MKKKAVIFGLDGVICNMETYHFLSWRQIAEELEIPFTREMNQELIGLSRMDSLKKILENYPGGLSDAELEVLAEQKNDLFKSYLLQLSGRDCDGAVKRVLQELKASGYLLAVASSSRNAGTIIKKLGLDAYFDTVSDGNSAKKAKPRPDVFQNICEYLNVIPEECLIVEGTRNGLQAGEQAGMATVSLKKIVGFDVEVLSNIAELPAYIDKML